MAARILNRIHVLDNGCWIHHKDPAHRGYTNAQLTTNGRAEYYMAHRVTYTAARGPIPPGMTIDHSCERPSCVNPDHLHAIPHRENVLRSKTNPTAINARRKRCKKGHEYATNARGRRYCPQCNREKQLARYYASKGQGAA